MDMLCYAMFALRCAVWPTWPEIGARHARARVCAWLCTDGHAMVGHVHGAFRYVVARAHAQRCTGALKYAMLCVSRYDPSLAGAAWSWRAARPVCVCAQRRMGRPCYVIRLCGITCVVTAACAADGW